jgi:acyl carrier protein
VEFKRIVGVSMSEIARSEVISKVNAVMMDLFELPEEKFKPEAHLFNDLGLDSLDAIDLMMKFQEQFGVRPSNQDLMNIRTLNDVHTMALGLSVDAPKILQ